MTEQPGLETPLAEGDGQSEPVKLRLAYSEAAQTLSEDRLLDRKQHPGTSTRHIARLRHDDRA